MDNNCLLHEPACGVKLFSANGAFWQYIERMIWANQFMPGKCDESSVLRDASNCRVNWKYIKWYRDLYSENIL